MIATVFFNILLWTACNFRTCECWFAGNGRSTPSRDLTPPTITCPSNIHAVADPLLLNTSVTWNENNVITNDDMDSSVLRTRTGPGPGSSFSEGVASVTYHVRDKGGNFNWCSFNVTVEVVRCSKWAPLQNGWKACNVPNDMRLGTMCNFSCYEGHVLQGPRERTCLQTGQWDDASAPYCQKIECDELQPKSNQVGLVNITCTADNYLGSSCVYTCKKGYGLLPGANALKLCTENSTWLGDTPICYDASSSNRRRQFSEVRRKMQRNSVGLVRIKLKVQRSLMSWGNRQDYHVGVFGSVPQLGMDCPERAARCSSSISGRFWTKDIWVPKCSVVTFKFVVCKSLNNDVLECESISARVLTTGNQPTLIETIYNNSYMTEQEDTAAPVFVDCSEVVVRYASSGNTSGIISWPTPQVVDNSGAAVSAVQVLGPKPGALLSLGQYAVKYTASDTRNNTGICDIVLAVKQITCAALEQYPYTTVVCHQGRALGSVCYISCEGDTVLTGSSTLQCVQSVNDSSRGVWNVEPQPYCKVTDRCPTPEKPVHGQLQCEVWESGRFCQMTCDDGYVVTEDPLTVYDEVQTYDTLLVCDETDTWLYDGDLPHCQEIELKEEITVSVSIDYTTVLDCLQLEEASEEVINSTIMALETAFQYVCPSPNCTVISAQMFCIDSMGRSVMIEATVDIDPESSPIELARIQTDLFDTMQQADTLDELSMDVNDTRLAAVDFDMSQLIVKCKNGSAVDLRTLQCVQCNAGYYYDNTSRLCAACPLGFYQNESRQYTCKSCPVGTSTPFRAATSSSQCLESCQVGHYSKTGTVPCSACGLGSFTEKNASIQCRPCPGAQITLTSGAQSANQCQDFDLTFLDMGNTSNSSGASVSVTLEMTFTLSFWVSCTECSDILTLKVNGDSLLALTNVNNLTVHLNSSGLHPTQVDISTSKPWNIISLVHTEHYLDMFVGDLLVLHQSLSEPVIQDTSSPVVIIIGAGSFQGRFAQLHIWSRTDVPIYNDNYTCLMGLSGDLLNWRHFAEADGRFVVTATKCDEIDDCASSPCNNGAECKDTDDGYKCTCTPGYSGMNCSVNINDCTGNVCHNGGTCVDSVAGYKCTCTKNRTGNLCQTLIVNGGWTSWGTSGVCSVTCGQGIQQRTRVCENPTPKNGGTNCTGSTVDNVKCGNINNTCPSKCTDEPSILDYGELNCQTIVSSKNETHVCHPACHQGYDFDNDIYVNTSGLTCGPDTGYTWNNYNDDNPFSQIPSCTAKTKAQKNTLYFSGTYNTLNSLDASLVTDVTNIVTAKIGQAGCVKTKSCKLQSTAVTLASNGRKKRSLSNRVTFTATITCVPSSLDNCYNLLQSLVDTLNLYITQNQFTVTWGGSQHNVTSSTTDGASECKQGYIPVLYYCVPCGKGAYADSNYCVLCARGTYQDLIGQTSCKQCPDGSTTAGLMTRDRDLCNIQVVPTNTQVNWQIILVSCLGGVVCFALISYVLFVIYDRWIKEPLHKCLRRKPKVEEEVKEVPKTPPPVRFNLRKKWFMGKPIRVDKNKVFDSDDTYSQQFETDITFDVVEDLKWKDHDFSSMELPRTPESNRPWSPPIWNSSPKSMKHSQAWR